VVTLFLKFETQGVIVAGFRALGYLISAHVESAFLLFVAWWIGRWADEAYPMAVSWWLVTFGLAFVIIIKLLVHTVRLAAREGRGNDDHS
jgi:Na+-transporting NADH:ubiquinone oxidoreductase subunit NqrB